MQMESIRAFLQEHQEEMRQKFRAEIVGLFGSRVRGEERPASDLDVLVRFLPGATLFDLVGLADFLEERFQMKVDIVPVDTLRPEIREQVLQEVAYL